MPDLVGWYRQAKSSTHGLTGEEKTPHWEGLSRQGYRFHHASGTHDGTTLGLCGHKIAMEDDPNATPEVLMKAMEDMDPHVRWQAARHRNATPEVLMKAMEDKWLHVRWTAARHPNATVGMKAEWVINALKSRSEGELYLFFQQLEFNRGEFIMSDLIRLIITDKRVDLGGLDMFQEAVQDYKFDNPIVSRMIKREKMKRKTDA